MKIVVVSSLLPSGHYSQYLTRGLSRLPGLELIVYTDKDKRNLRIQGCGAIKNVWTKSGKFVSEIMRELKIDAPDAVHLQHEINMFGGTLTAVAFPLLLLLLKLKKIRRIVTIHCVVPKAMVDRKFGAYFHKDSRGTNPTVVKMFFSFLYGWICRLSDQVIVHTRLTKDCLRRDYGVPDEKISVIPTAIPDRGGASYGKKDNFLYFGYIVRRKGLPYVLSGFSQFLQKVPACPFNLVLAGGVIKGQEQARQEIADLISADKRLNGRVIMKGFVEEGELDALYGHAVAVVIPAEISMGSSGPLYHALSYRKCALASKVGHLVEEIEHLKTGYLVDNDRWQEAFQFCLDDPTRLALIEKNIGEATKGRTPLLTAEKHFKVYAGSPCTP